jgi:predicted Rossmann fold flavoprotein
VSVPSVITAEDGTVFRENLLFTHRGLSGPAVLQISSYWQPGSLSRLTCCRLRSGCVPQRAAYRAPESKPEKHPGNAAAETSGGMFAGAGADPGRVAKQLNSREQETLVETLTNWRVQPNGTEGYRTAEVTLGGVDTNELSSRTMEARNVPGLYFIGEVMDVTGWLGGYNFQWAWASAWACARRRWPKTITCNKALFCAFSKNG